VADKTPRHRKASARTKAFGVAVAVIAHLAVLTALVLAIEIPRLPQAPAIQVSLVPAWRVLPHAPPKPPPPPPRPERAIAPRPARLVGPETPPPLSIPAGPPDAAARGRLLAAPFITPHEPVRDSLRTAGGCTEADWLKLSEAERDKCRQRAHALGAGAPTYAVGPSDPSKRAFLDKQAARNEARRRSLEAPPTPAMTGCPDSRFSNLGFSCVP
jgi:hypothetical protein